MVLKESLLHQSPSHCLKTDLASGAFSYSSVVGMLLNLSGHTRPDITFAVNCCAHFMFCPKHSHALALKRIGRYLKQTPDRGMVMNPSITIYRCAVLFFGDSLNRCRRGGKRVTMVMMFVGGVVLMFDGFLVLFLL